MSCLVLYSLVMSNLGLVYVDCLVLMSPFLVMCVLVLSFLGMLYLFVVTHSISLPESVFAESACMLSLFVMLFRICSFYSCCFHIFGSVVMFSFVVVLLFIHLWLLLFLSCCHFCSNPRSWLVSLLLLL